MRLYVLVRNDLPCSSPAVQAGHAVAEFMRRHPGAWENQTLVYLNAGDKVSLDAWACKLQRDGFELVRFHEPDIDSELTAIAVLNAGKSVKRLPLLA